MSERFFAAQPSPEEIKRRMMGYTSWLEINLDNVGFNLCNIRERVGVEVMPVVKNNAYGHGLVPIVAYLETQGVAWVMVAKLREAEMIKEAGFETEVLNMDVLFAGDGPFRIEGHRLAPSQRIGDRGEGQLVAAALDENRLGQLDEMA